jgi:hypothetical protein
VITELSIGNFKAFGATQRLPIKPLTLIFGANSSGKSSIIHSLLLARAVMEKGAWDVNRTEAGGDSVDLGGFGQYIHRRDRSFTLNWGLCFEPKDIIGPAADCFDQGASTPGAQRSALGVRLNIGIPTGTTEEWNVRPEPQILQCDLVYENARLLRLQRSGDRQAELHASAASCPLLRRRISETLAAYGTEFSGGPAAQSLADEVIKDMLENLIALDDGWLPNKVVRSSTHPGPEVARLVRLAEATTGRKKDFRLAEVIDLALPPLLDSLVATYHQTICRLLASLVYLGPFRNLPHRAVATTDIQDANWLSGGGYAWERLRTDMDVRNAVNRWLGDEQRLATPYRFEVDRLLDIEFIRNGIKRWIFGDPSELEEEETSDRDFYRNETDPEFRARKLMQQLGATQATYGTNLLKLVDLRNRTQLSLRDVGVGISQIVPVLVYSYAATGQTLAVEQPEIHLHPALQAELGDVFIESALGERKNTFILETHSEHLILRIMRRMRETHEGRLPKGLPSVRPQDVSIVFVEPSASGSIIREMDLNERGELVKAWPGGFFEEGLREMLP